MNTPIHPRPSALLQSFPQSASITVALLGGGVLLGWALDIPSLKSVLPGLVTMKANTAAAFILSSVSLWVLGKKDIGRRAQRTGQICAGLVALVGLLTLSEYTFHQDLGIDQLLFREAAGAVGTSQPGRMAPTTAANFLLLGLALAFLHADRGHRLTAAFVLLTALVSLFALIGYLFGVQSLYGIASYTPMAVHTAFAFLVLCVGVLLASADRGVMAVLTGEGAGGAAARQLLPAAIAIPTVLGWLRLQGQRAGFYDLEFGVALTVLFSVVIFALLIWRHARALQRTDHARQRAEEDIRRLNTELERRVALLQAEVGKRRRLEEELELFFALSQDMFCLAGFDGYFKRLNPAWEKTLGFSLEELVARPYLEFVHADDREATLAEAQKLTTGVRTISFKNRYLCKDRAYRWLLWNATPLPDGQMIYATAHDITVARQAEEQIRKLNTEMEQRVAELAATNRELDAFTYSVSHDLRSPLRHIEGFSRLLLEEYSAGLPDQARQYLTRVREGALRMGQLVDDLLKLSRVGRKELSLQLTGLNSLVQEVVGELKSETSGRAIQWEIQPLPFVECDPALIKQVFANLLSNAVKYTRPRERAVIEVGSMTRDGGAAVFVRDNGVGFSMKYAAKLFGVFQRLHRQEDFEGTGVGLATVERIVHKHGGRLWAEAELNRGAAFYFTLGPTPGPGPQPKR